MTTPHGPTPGGPDGVPDAGTDGDTAGVLVPPVRHSIHAVLTVEPVPHPDAADPRGVPHAPGLTIPPRGMLRRFGASDDELDAVAARSHVTLLHRSGPVATAPADALAARTEAVDLARDLDGVLLDLAVPRVVPLADAPDVAVATQWVGFDIEPGPDEDAGPTLSSFGLSTFGLPELRHELSSSDLVPAALAVLSGLAHRMIAEWPEHDPVGPATITLTDVGHGLGDALGTSSTRGLAIEITPTDDPGVLRVEMADDPRVLFA